MIAMNLAADTEILEVSLLLEAIFQRFGRDFRHYNRENVREKLRCFMAAHSVSTLSALQEKVLHDTRYIEPLLRALENPPPALFEHPERLLKLRETLVPWLRSCPAPRVWIVDAIAAEQIFWLSILLQEENLLHKTQIYVTASDAERLAEARWGRFAANLFALYAENYRRAGGKSSLVDYCVRVEDRFIFNAELHTNITWAEYHLGRDASLNEFEAIICCADLSAFTLQRRHHANQVFRESQPMFGVLALANENFVAISDIPHYRALNRAYGIYQRC